MILSAQSIRKRCIYPPNHDLQGKYIDESPLILPFYERSVHPKGLSYGLSSAGYDVRLGQDVNIPPRGFTLGATLERFNIPHNLLMRVHDKSTWARKGIFVQNTVAEPGWYGYLTLEISNETKEWVYLESGIPIAQVIFEMLDEPTQQAYCGRYQDQVSGPQPARFAVDGDETKWKVRKGLY